MKREILTLTEAKELLRISSATLRRLLAKELMGCYRVGHRIMFSEQHINDYLNGVERQTRVKTLPRRIN